MAVTLIDRYRLRFATTGIRQRVIGACLKEATAILVEATNTANHANRVIWANQVISNPEPKADQMMAQVATNATVLTSYNPLTANEGVTDGDLEFIVGSAVNTYATGA
jgi:hypothetical protein